MLMNKTKCRYFYNLRYEFYFNKKFQFDWEKFPSTSKGIKNPIKRAFFQCYVWQHASFVPDISVNLTDYGFIKDGDMGLIPLMIGGSNNFSIPCM